MPFRPSQPIHLDPNGTCKIYYGCPNHANSSFSIPTNLKEVRNVEFRFHMEKDSTGRPLPVEANDFENNCPIWHFFGQSTRIRPAFALRLTCDGTGKIPKDYNVMFGLLRELLHSLRSDEFEHVTVQLGLGYHADERLALRDEFEELMGKATVMDGNEGRHMEFCPRDFKEEWNAAN